MELVGIIGKKGSGKTECANVLIQNYGFQKVSFADKLKQVVSDLFDIPINCLYDPNLKETYDHRWGKTYREIMQLFGTEVGRCIYNDIWIYHTEKRILQNSDDKIVIDDVRFKNEANLIKRQNGLLLKIIRPSVSQEQSLHASEVEQDEIKEDILLVNNSTKEDLYKNLDEIFHKFFSRIK